MKAVIIYFMLFLALIPTAGAQVKTPSYESYIRQYGALSAGQQKKYHVPASITLAQGLLESGAGQSELAKKSNNHFGIKCHSGWSGETVYYDDDAKGECFRKYKSVEDSFEDHSVFLSGRPIYANLFKLDIRDYQGWAKGLQEAGYATDRAYANRLIKLIEDYELYRYDSDKWLADNEAGKKTEKPKTARWKRQAASFVVKRPVHDTQGMDYVYAEDNDSFERLAEDTGLTTGQLKQFNEMPDDFPLRKGDMIYIEKKKTRAAKPHYDHVVQIGESMHSISQRYGMKVKNLYKLNKKKEDYVPITGDVLKLR
ncbi:MAG: glucosaminidase domain-containing protein [Tannerellaceae bacterium]|jgi:hypothetical protein|nr:glucosaminidase domain-containing protein [Tannerellaceae bacterium]